MFQENRDKLRDVNVVVLAVCELEESGVDLAKSLNNAQYLVYKMRGEVG